MTQPMLRKDLETVEQAGALIVKDPVANKFYRFTGASALVLRALDGETAPDAIPARLAREASVRISQESAAQFVHRLRDSGLLEGSAPADESRPGRAEDILNIRIKALDPRRIFDWLLPRASFLFTPAFVAISAILMLAAVYVSITRGQEIGGTVLQLVTPSGLPEFLLIALTIGVIHEFAHGLACEHFGARVREIGFLPCKNRSSFS